MLALSLTIATRLRNGGAKNHLTSNTNNQQSLLKILTKPEETPRVIQGLLSSAESSMNCSKNEIK